MQHVRPIAERVVRYVFDRWLKKMEKFHFV